MPKLHRILFICHGNICRSTMAEYVMKDLVAKRGREVAQQFVIDSAATSTEEIGNPVHHGTRRVLESQGIYCGDHRARRIRKDEVGDWDMIIIMDENNRRNLKRHLRVDVHPYKLMEFVGEDRDVADPWYTGDFETTYDDVRAGCEGLLSYLGF